MKKGVATDHIKILRSIANKSLTETASREALERNNLMAKSGATSSVDLIRRAFAKEWF